MSIARDEGALWQRNSVRSAAMLLPVAAVAALAVSKWPMIGDSAGRLGQADAEWMAVAVFAACMTWVCSAVAQQGAVVMSLPPGRLLATQFAASAANHVLPAGVGGNAVNLRFLVRHGMTPTRSLAALAVRASAAAIGRVTVLLVLLALFPDALQLHRLAPDGFVLPADPMVIGAVALALLVLAFVASRYVGRARDRARCFLASMADDVRTLHRDRARVACLWGGSLAFPTMHASVVVAVVKAVHAPVPVSGVLVAYFFASTAAGWLPTPAGLGSLDAALALALVTAGASAVAATSAVLGYRLVTTWLPLIPGVVVLAVLVKRREL
ncbi:lysylphosphatidylglycerol synthase domain-containing protein [Streptomyces sp. CBMA29]|uniref:lysylphosphatidylglycerol synthase domain-containing protein n=1 Tax=Streptomyces sp. CBMA29 TaxID=1896314 RepID=UPI002948BD9F|nr:lysylphosphatidylglycerol synthase domain-containing protein [Streptomyces sp. CBMA29]